MHAELIDALGGIAIVAEHCGVRNLSTVGNWRVRGVSWPYRRAVAALAKKKRVTLPDGFLGQEAAA
jgi:hypothetical protein